MSESPVRALQFIEGGARYGAAVSIMNIAEGMRHRDVDVEFAVFAGRPLGDVLRDRGFKVHEIHASRRYDLRGIAELTRLLRKEKFDVLHTHLSKATIIGIAAARLARVPVVSTVHGMNKKFTYMLSDHIMTVSEAAKQHLVTQGVPASKVTAVYNCIAPGSFAERTSPAEAKSALGFPASAFVLGTIARAHRQKGIDIAISAVADLRRRGIDARYLFLGDGPHLDQFKAQTAELGLTEFTRFPGFSGDIATALAAMDVFIFPTLREAFGISLLEAMVAGVPVVASNVDGVPEVLADGSGILVDEHTPEAFADAAERLLREPDLNRAIVEAARRRAETVFSVERTASGVEQVYRSAIHETRKSPRRGYRGAL